VRRAASPRGVVAGVQDLLAAESRLDRSFSACVGAAVLGLAWPTYLRMTDQRLVGWTWPVAQLLFAAFVIAYAWFAFSVAVAARGLGRSRGPYIAWLTAAPILWLLLPVPILASVILASPLSLKFLLSAQLREEIHDRTFD
jgi:hypothetical protein